MKREVANILTLSAPDIRVLLYYRHICCTSLVSFAVDCVRRSAAASGTFSLCTTAVLLASRFDSVRTRPSLFAEKHLYAIHCLDDQSCGRAEGEPRGGSAKRMGNYPAHKVGDLGIGAK